MPSAQQATPPDTEQRQCARGDWCSEPRITGNANGTITRQPALVHRPYCETDRLLIIRCLDELPSAYERLQEALGDPPLNGASSVRRPLGPSEPVRGDVDALMRIIAPTLCCWAARVRSSRLQLAPSGVGGDVHAAAAVTDAAEVTGKNIDVLLALDYGWMTRTYTFPTGKTGALAAPEARCRHCGRRINCSIASGYWFLAERDAASSGCPAAGEQERGPGHEPAECIRGRPRAVFPVELESLIGDREIVYQGDGWVTVLDRLDGAAAGLEILDLHYRARRLLGETRAQPESFEGVPCRGCGDFALVRAEPPSDPARQAAHSVCASCGHTMDRTTYLEWSAWYSRWADSSGLACRHCRKNNHDACTWEKCDCRAQAHQLGQQAA